MSVFSVTFSREFTIQVEANSQEEVEAAAQEALFEIDREWNPPEYDFFVRDGRGKPDHGIVEGEIVHIDDARKYQGCSEEGCSEEEL